MAADAARGAIDSRAGNEDWLADMANLELPRGHARFAGAPEAIERAIDYDDDIGLPNSLDLNHLEAGHHVIGTVRRESDADAFAVLPPDRAHRSCWMCPISTRSRRLSPRPNAWRGQSTCW